MKLHALHAVQCMQCMGFENMILSQIMDKLRPTGQNLDRVFNFRSGHLHATHLWCYEAKLPNLKLKTRPKQHRGFLPFDIALPAQIQLYSSNFGLSLQGILKGEVSLYR